MEYTNLVRTAVDPVSLKEADEGNLLGKGSFRKPPFFNGLVDKPGGGSQQSPLTYGGPFLAFFGRFLSRFRAF